MAAQQLLGTATGSGSGDSPVDTRLPLSALLLQITLSKAADLARVGRYSEAEGLLSEATRGEKIRPEILDLLARIHAQQGRFLEAQAFWTQASQLDPSNEVYQAALRRIAKTQSQPVWLASLLPLMVWLAVGLGVTIIGFTVKNYVSKLDTSLRSEVAKIAARQEALASRLFPEKPPDVKVGVPGVSPKTEANEIVITFDSGLFNGDANLRPEAKTVLSALGRQMGVHVGRISVRVVGHTDDVPMPAGAKYRDNLALGMSRAVAVVEHLRSTTQLPAGTFSVSSLGEYLTPYPNDTHEDRARNRTVVIRISEIRR